MNARTITDKQLRSAVSLSTKVERLASLNAQIKAREEEANTIKAEIFACGLDYIEGSAHYVTVSHGIRTTLDPERVRAMLSPEAYAQCAKTAPVHSIRVHDL